jgi:hypothetical protein
MRGFDYFDTAVEVCGKVKDPDEKITGRKSEDPPFQKPNPKR